MFFFFFTTINKRSNRKQKIFEKKEAEYQIVQEHFSKYRDKASWNQMFLYINAAVFNSLNKKLEFILDHEDIEGKALDVTSSIMTTLQKKIAEGKEWKIGKLSSFVHMPCMAIYSPQSQFNDRILTEDFFYDPETEVNLFESEKMEYNTNTGFYTIT